MRPELIAIKYIGVPTVAELRENAEAYGWKCRKYSGWKKVHIERDDVGVLHRMADSLIDKGEVDCAVYGRISEIWLRIQRWKIDKIDLRIEPPRKAAWERISVGTQVALQHPHSIVSFLHSRGAKKELNAHDGSMLFLLQHFSDLLRNTGMAPAVVLPDCTSPESQAINGLNKAAAALVDQLYKEQCANIDTSVKGLDLINLVLNDLEIADFMPPEHLPYADVDIDGEPNVIVEYSILGKDKLIETKMIKGKTIVVLNKDHVGLQNIREMTGNNAMEILFAAMGATVNDMSAKENVLNDYLALFSLHLIQLSSGGVLSSK